MGDNLEDYSMFQSRPFKVRAGFPLPTFVLYLGTQN